tara:strand:- start:495 stop:1088 length:594 start_codon:yes stop_codon:yes gene_type:complete
MSGMKVIIEKWDRYLNEEDAASSITTIGDLHKYFEKKDPSTLKKFAAKYGGISAKVLGVVAGASTGGAGGVVAATAVSWVAGEVVEQMLMASIMAFANLEDGTYPEGSAASYFDLEDNLTLFLRDIESQGKDFTKPTQPEMEVFTIMKKKIQAAVKGKVDPSTTIADLLKDVTSQAVMDSHLKSGQFAGRVKVEPAL